MLSHGGGGHSTNLEPYIEKQPLLMCNFYPAADISQHVQMRRQQCVRPHAFTLSAAAVDVFDHFSGRKRRRRRRRSF